MGLGKVLRGHIYFHREREEKIEEANKDKEKGSVPDILKRNYNEGWAPEEEGRDATLEYRLTIDNAQDEDSGSYTCVTPSRHRHKVQISVRSKSNVRTDCERFLGLMKAKMFMSRSEEIFLTAFPLHNCEPFLLSLYIYSCRLQAITGTPGFNLFNDEYDAGN